MFSIPNLSWAIFTVQLVSDSDGAMPVNRALTSQTAEGQPAATFSLWPNVEHHTDPLCSRSVSNLSSIYIQQSYKPNKLEVGSSAKQGRHRYNCGNLALQQNNPLQQLL